MRVFQPSAVLALTYQAFSFNPVSAEKLIVTCDNDGHGPCKDSVVQALQDSGATIINHFQEVGVIVAEAEDSPDLAASLGTDALTIPNVELQQEKMERVRMSGQLYEQLRLAQQLCNCK